MFQLSLSVLFTFGALYLLFKWAFWFKKKQEEKLKDAKKEGNPKKEIKTEDKNGSSARNKR